jgi:preprotein translocase subunit SecE
MENQNVEVVETVEEKKAPVRNEVKAKIEKQIAKKHAKLEGKSRILDYLKEEHKWENWLFLVVSSITLLLGILILTSVLVVKDSIPVIGDYPKVFAWILVAISGLGLLYALWPFYKPALPEFKKVTWTKGMKFVGNIIRVFLYIFIFAGLFLLYDAFIQEIFERIIG